MKDLYKILDVSPKAKKVVIWLILILTTVINLRAASATILIEYPGRNQNISGYMLNSVSENGLIVQEDIGLVRKFTKNNLTEGKVYEFWVIPYSLNSKGIKMFGESSDHKTFIPKTKSEDKLPNKPKIRILNEVN